MKEFVSVIFALALPLCAFSQTPVCDDIICMLEEHGGIIPVGEIINMILPQ